MFANAQSQENQHNGKQGTDVKVIIKVEDLNLAIKTYIEKNYPNYLIEKGMSLNTDGVPTLYKVGIKNGEEVRMLTFDKDYNFLSIIDPKKEKRTKTPTGNRK